MGGGIFFKGLKLIDQSGKNYYIPLGWKSRWDANGVTIISENESYRISLRDTTYNTIHELVAAICACSESGGSGGLPDPSKMYDSDAQAEAAGIAILTPYWAGINHIEGIAWGVLKLRVI